MRFIKPSRGISSNKTSMPALAAGLAMLLASAVTAPAAPITFGQFNEQTTGNPNLFSYTETGIAGGTATIFATSIPVSFSYVGISGLPTDLQGNQNATLTISSTTSQLAATLGGGFDDQQFPVSSTLTITRDTAASEGRGSMDVLLNMTFTGQLFAALGGNTAQLTGQTALGYTVTYGSDFLNFSNSTPQNYAISFSSWVSTADSGGVETDAVSGMYNAATAAGTGTFDASISTINFFPEPSSLGLLAFAAVPMLRPRRAMGK